MTTEFKFHLDKTSKKFVCPACRQKRFVLYINTGSQEYLSEKVGRCDREDSCGYHFTPKEYFVENPEAYGPTFTEQNFPDKPVPKIASAISFLPFEIMNTSVTGHRLCSLYPFLQKLFGDEIASVLCQEYFIGTSRENNTAFWQVDIEGRIRQVKVMQYNSETGRRNKETGAIFAGKKILGDNEANLQQCFFGEFLLSLPENDNKKVAIVESEKTAVIASIYYPEFVWLATGGKHGCKWTEATVCKVLQGRKIILFPDLGAFESWSNKALLLAAITGCKVAVSDTLERIATPEEKTNGLDLADYLLQNSDSSCLALTDDNYPVIWDYSNFKSICYE